MRLAVTISGKADPELERVARLAAERWGLPFHSRARKEPLGAALGAVADAFLSLGRDGWALWDTRGVLRYSLGMAALRIKRLRGGVDDDQLVRHGELRPGDWVLDGTLGLGADASVCASVVGTTGRVVGTESSLALFALASEGMAAAGPTPGACRVEVMHAPALSALQTLPDASFDCITFDPMFARRQRASPAFEMLRRFADHRPLTAALLAEARRVARRWVLVKGARRSDELRQLGLTPLPGSRHSPVVWARVAGHRTGR